MSRYLGILVFGCGTGMPWTASRVDFTNHDSRCTNGRRQKNKIKIKININHAAASTLSSPLVTSSQPYHPSSTPQNSPSRTSPSKPSRRQTSSPSLQNATFLAPGTSLLVSQLTCTPRATTRQPSSPLCPTAGIKKTEIEEYRWKSRTKKSHYQMLAVEYGDNLKDWTISRKPRSSG